MATFLCFAGTIFLFNQQNILMLKQGRKLNSSFITYWVTVRSYLETFLWILLHLRGWNSAALKNWRNKIKQKAYACLLLCYDLLIVNGFIYVRYRRSYASLCQKADFSICLKGVNLCGLLFCERFFCGNLFLRIKGNLQNPQKLKLAKNFIYPCLTNESRITWQSHWSCKEPCLIWATADNLF